MMEMPLQQLFSYHHRVQVTLESIKSVEHELMQCIINALRDVPEEARLRVVTKAVEAARHAEAPM